MSALLKFGLVCLTVLAMAASGWADVMTTNVVLTAPYANPFNTSGVVNITAGTGAGLSYGVAAKGINNGAGPGNNFYATGEITLGQYSTGLTSPNLVGSPHNLVLTYALQGKQITPVGGATNSAQFTSGVFAIYDVGSTLPVKTNVNTWGPLSGGKLVYLAGLGSPVATTQGQFPAFGDPNFAGQPLAGQNEANFFAASGVHAPGAFIAFSADVEMKTLLSPPLAFNGVQLEIDEFNSLPEGGGFTPGTGNDNASLDRNFAAVMALLPNQPINSASPFTTNGYLPLASGATGDSIQEIGVTIFPVFAPNTPPIIPPGTPGVPEPVSLVLFGLAIVGGLAYRGLCQRVR